MHEYSCAAVYSSPVLPILQLRQRPACCVGLADLQLLRVVLDKSQPLRQGDAGDASALGLVKQLVLHVHRHLPPRNRFLNRKGRNENIISVTAEVHSCEHRFL